MPVDPISLQVYTHLLASVAEEMGETLRRSAFSPNIRERLDYSCAVFDESGRMIAQAAHIPVHLGSMPASVRSALSVVSEWHDGDVVVLNDPYHGGSHLPDITMVSPILLDGRVAYFVASRAHHADVGGMSPGSLPLSTELYQEGLIIPPIKLVDAGKTNTAVLTLMTANSRGASERVGDLDAQLAANRTGAARLRDLIDSNGAEAVAEHADALIAYARRMTESVIRALPDGTYTFEDGLEGDGQTDIWLPIRATLTVSGDRLMVDFTGSAPQTRGSVNTVRAVTQSAVWYCLRLLSLEDVPVNHGTFSVIEVLVPEKSLLNAEFPAAVAVGNTETSQRIADVVLGALAQAVPERIPAASQGSMNNVTLGGTGLVYYETIGGGHGGSPDGAGISGRHSHLTNTRNTPIEAVELAYPLRVRAYHLRDGSGGAGAHPGGEGIRRVIEARTELTATVNSERRTQGAYGLSGGSDGQPGRNTVVLADGSRRALGAKATVRLNAGDRLEIETPGGGGWGNPA